MVQKKSDKEAPGADDIMSHHEMKPILALAYNRSISCALALTEDDEAAFLLHRKTGPKKLRSVLADIADEKGVALATKVFFGRVRISADNLVTIVINRELPGGKWAKALRVPLRKAGYPDFIITADSTVETESDDDEEDSPSAGKDIQQDLTRRLETLLKSMPKLLAQAPAKKDRIGRLAARATDMVKAGDGSRATNAVNELDAALRAIPDEAKAEAARMKAAVVRAAQAFQRIGKALVAHAEKRSREAQESHSDDGQAAAAAEFFRDQALPASRRLIDSGLGRLFATLLHTDDAEERAELLRRALDTIEALEKSVRSDPMFAKVDDNSFIPLRVAQASLSALKALESRLRPVAA